jgi:hypothetical protein
MNTLSLPYVYADFNGLFGDILCLSHSDTCIDKSGNIVHLKEGMILSAYDEDADDQGISDDLFATGIVAPSPPSLACRGSRWILKIDENGVRHQSDVSKNKIQA